MSVVASEVSPSVNLTAAFSCQLPRSRRSIGYHAGMLVTAAVMVLLPVIYLAMIVGVGWLTFWHATTNAGVFQEAGARAGLFLYVAPLVVGVSLVGLMVKPLFAPRAQEPTWVEVSRSEEPVLWAFVEQLCAMVRAPSPRRIRIESVVNASAGFRRGFVSMVSNDLVLTIGLPLVAGLSLRQFTGVLAHEFGHFSQGGGMRATYVIRRVNMWLARVAFERDAWDEQLEEASGSGWGWFAVVAGVTRLFIAITRSILKGLMYAGHAVSCFMARRMEFDADRFAIRTVGTETFVSSFEQMAFLDVAYGGAIGHSGQLWEQRKLPDSLPHLVLRYVDKLPEEARRQIAAELMKPNQHAFSTHPSTAARVEAARKLNAPGVFAVDAPATVLFRDFRAACLRVSYDEFKARLGDRIMEATFVPVEGIIEEDQRRVEAGVAMREFLRGCTCLAYPPRLGREAVSASVEPRRDARELFDLAMQNPDDEATAAANEAGRAALARLDELHCVRTMLEGGLRLGVQKYNVTHASLEEVEAETSAAQKKLDAALPQIERGCSNTARRLRLGLALALAPGMEQRFEHASDWRIDIEKLAPVLQDLEAVHAEVMSLRRLTGAIEAVSAGLRREQKPEGVAKFKELVAQANAKLARIRACLASTPYPYEHAQPQLTVAEYLISGVVNPEVAQEVFGASCAMYDGYSDLYGRILTDLCAIASRVEELVVRLGEAKAAGSRRESRPETAPQAE